MNFSLSIEIALRWPGVKEPKWCISIPLLSAFVSSLTRFRRCLSKGGCRDNIALRGCTKLVLGLVTDIAQKDKNEAKRTKPSTGMERVREIKAEGGKFTQSYASKLLLEGLLTHLTHLGAMLAIPINVISGFDVEGNQGLKLIDQELVMIGWS
ncbi:hypothetical protein Tco_0057972 [Tanacetum coccineum]